MNPVKVELHGDVYSKRVKLFYNHIWVNTKPLIIKDGIILPPDDNTGSSDSSSKNSSESILQASLKT